MPRIDPQASCAASNSGERWCTIGRAIRSELFHEAGIWSACERGEVTLDLLEARYIVNAAQRGEQLKQPEIDEDFQTLAPSADAPTDAILDRLVHNAHRLTLNGDSMRKAAAKRSGLDASPAS